MSLHEDEVKLLENKYLFHFKDMTDEEVESFYSYNLNNKSAEFRQDRLIKLLGEIEARRRYKEGVSKTKERNYKLAKEYAELTFKWEELGAYFKNEGHKGYFEEVVWYYNDVEYYRWGGNIIGEDRYITNFIIKAREADERLRSIISKGV